VISYEIFLPAFFNQILPTPKMIYFLILSLIYVPFFPCDSFEKNPVWSMATALL
jgi:hypothetical protein